MKSLFANRPSSFFSFVQTSFQTYGRHLEKLFCVIFSYKWCDFLYWQVILFHLVFSKYSKFATDFLMILVKSGFSYVIISIYDYSCYSNLKNMLELYIKNKSMIVSNICLKSSLKSNEKLWILCLPLLIVSIS